MNPNHHHPDPRLHPLFSAYPLDRECETSLGYFPIPYHVYDGWTLVIGGTTRLSKVRELMKNESYQPIEVASQRPGFPNGAMALIWLCDFTNASLGPHTEVQVSFLASVNLCQFSLLTHFRP